MYTDAEEEPNPNAPLDVDEELTLIERVERFCTNGPPVQRNVFVREIACSAEAAPVPEVVGRIVPLLKVVANDPELAIRHALAEQMAGLSRVLLSEPDARASSSGGAESGAGADGGATAYECVLRDVVPLLTSLLTATGPDVPGGGGGQLAEAASEALLDVARLIEPSDVGDHVLRSVLCLAHDNEVDENRIVAAQLLGALAPVLGAELCTQYVLHELVALADDPAFRVRKAAALRVGQVATVVGPELASAKLLPVFEQLSRDEIWGVRKAAVESLAEVSAALPEGDRGASGLEKLMHEFHHDSSRWVRIAACQALGPFIASLPAGAVSPPLLALYTDLANPQGGGGGGGGGAAGASDADVAFSCAYNFPAVAQAVGPSRWHEVSASFAALASNIQWKVRRTLAYALHDLAACLGPQITEAELLPTFDTFLRDLDEVKVGVIASLARFLDVLPPPTRLTYLPTLAEIKAETDNWRFRYLLAAQLSAFGAAFPRAEVEATLLPLGLSLCTDTVAEVRIAAVAEIGALVKHVVGGGEGGGGEAAAAEGAAEGAAEVGEAVRQFVETVGGMAAAPSCFKRANCVQICASLLEFLPPPLAAKALLPRLTPLAADRVANVRLALATLAKARLMPPAPLAALPAAAELVAALQRDADRDVLRMIHPEGYEPPPYRCKPPPPSSSLHQVPPAASERDIGAGLDEAEEEDEAALPPSAAAEAAEEAEVL